ncbi:hypothetical protein [Frankia sp. AgB32]|uniref:hypothetical protein n=1 Tax=Frankia sp. AgB32 TaxID=631119 RepID=UPI00200E0EFF|nr:hypothetical protein [Frankia sp. AgB32]MCK9896952.1 hypothetical protein [Frankia sp. AgB32]
MSVSDGRQPDCPFCPDGHRNPATRNWGVRVSPEVDHDGQPVWLLVGPPDGKHHVAQSDADWLWNLIRNHRAGTASDAPRRFQLDRQVDVSGVSGTGIVADGVRWPDGSADVRWRGDRPSAVHWDRMEHAEQIHGHGGATRIVWLD